MKIFTSKRNLVYYKKGYVYKIYKGENAIEKAKYEEKILKHLEKSLVSIGKLIKRQENILQLEYIEGLPLPDYLEKEKVNNKELVDALIFWFSSFYKSMDTKNTLIIRGDVNGRNFIYKDKKIYGVDFEEEVIGYIEEDIGKFLAFITRYDNMEKEMIREIEELFFIKASKTWQLDKEKILYEQEKEYKRMKKRR